MSFLNKFLSGAGAVTDFVRRIVPGLSPFTVQEVEANTLAKYTVVIQEDLFVLYKDNTNYMGVIKGTIPTAKMYSMFQGIPNEQQAQSLFSMFSYRLQVLIRCSDRMMEKVALQNFSDYLRENPSWSCAHLAAKLQFSECFSNDAVCQSLNVADEVQGKTPIMIAIEEGDGGVECVKELILRGAKLNVADKQGQNVFHYAVKAHCCLMINQLAAKDKSMINGYNAVGETALHEACLEKQPDCIELLLRWGADPMITASTRFPIHCAAEGSDERCIAQLCRWSPAQVQLKDHLNGSTPLHYCKTRVCIYTLCDNGAEVDAVNNKCETALHVAVKNNYFDCAMGLVIRGADANTQDSNGDTTLHSAVMNDNWEITQLMIVFGAEVNEVNAAGVTARHLAATSKGENAEFILYLLHNVGATRCKSGASSSFQNSKDSRESVTVKVFGCKDGCSSTGKYDGKSKLTPVNPEYTTSNSATFCESLTDLSMPAAMSRSSSVAESSMGSFGSLPSTPRSPAGDRLLSLDGGGIRGMILMQVLMAVEKAAGKPIKECFDWIAGTSTGAILALGILHGKSLRTCLGLYFELKDKVFTGKRPYSSEMLEAFLQRAFGETTRMNEVEYPRVMVTGVLADRYPAELHLFRNYDIPGKDMKLYRRTMGPGGVVFEPVQRPNEQLVWKAARASGAAPTFFRSSGRYLDGGLMSNNPLLDMLTEVHQYNVALKSVGKADEVRPIHVVLSVGTGCIPIRKSDACDVYRPEGLFDLAKVAFGAKNLLELFVDQATQSNGHVVDRAAAWCSMINVPFYRLNPHLSDDLPLDCNDDQQLINMLWESQAYISQRRNRIQQLASLLTH